MAASSASLSRAKTGPPEWMSKCIMTRTHSAGSLRARSPHSSQARFRVLFFRCRGPGGHRPAVRERRSALRIEDVPIRWNSLSVQAWRRSGTAESSTRAVTVLSRRIGPIPPATQRTSFRRLNFPAFRSILSMQTNLSARFFCRVRTGWRRDEWAQSPLFICSHFWPAMGEIRGLAKRSRL
jgi:hypothetical protein